MVLNDDAALVKMSINGDTDAFGQLVLKYQNLVFNICCRSLRNREDAYDISQEVFIKAFRAIKSFRFECSFSTWIYKITQNALKDFVAKNSRQKSVVLSDLTLDEDNEIAVDIPDRDENSQPDISAERKEMIIEVRKAISELPELYREIIVLRDMEDYSYEEISELLGIGLGTVKSRINRARFQLKEILEQRNFFTETPSNKMN